MRRLQNLDVESNLPENKPFLDESLGIFWDNHCQLGMKSISYLWTIMESRGTLKVNSCDAQKPVAGGCTVGSC